MPVWIFYAVFVMSDGYTVSQAFDYTSLTICEEYRARVLAIADHSNVVAFKVSECRELQLIKKS